MIVVFHAFVEMLADIDFLDLNCLCDTDIDRYTNNAPLPND